MIIKSHWNIEYLISKFKNILHQKIHPDEPWLVADAVNFLKSWLKNDLSYLFLEYLSKDALEKTGILTINL